MTAVKDSMVFLKASLTRVRVSLPSKVGSLAGVIKKALANDFSRRLSSEEFIYMFFVNCEFV